MVACKVSLGGIIDLGIYVLFEAAPLLNKSEKKRKSAQPALSDE
jgi:hypothetical protein